jgi:hypothetical protein
VWRRRALRSDRIGRADAWKVVRTSEVIFEMTILLILLAVAPALCSQPQPAAQPYLGQPAPGTTPRIFAPGVVSKGNIHSRLVITADGREMFWNTVDMKTFSTQILSVRDLGGTWSDPQPPPFAREGSTQSPMLSPDGKRLYFNVDTADGWTTKYVEATAGGWGARRGDGFLLNCTSSFTRAGRVYYSSQMPTKAWNSGVFAARYSATEYSDATALGPAINAPNGIDYTPFVSPDESFLLFSSNRPLTGDKEDMHIYVSFRAADGTWSKPRRVSEIQGRYPSISPDGKYLFFCGDDGNFYWADATIIGTSTDAPRPQK